MRPAVMTGRALFLLALACAPGPAHACTLCHSDVAGQVRAALFGADLLENLLAVFAPAPVIAAAWWLLTGVRRGR